MIPRVQPMQGGATQVTQRVTAPTVEMDPDLVPGSAGNSPGRGVSPWYQLKGRGALLRATLFAQSGGCL